MTPSELHVARLAAAGLSNAAIARVRSTSIRTVANQMGRVLSELRVANRRALALRPEVQPLGPLPARGADWVTLSERERSMLAHITQGAQQKVIAIELGLAASTVSKSLHATRRRLGYESICDLTRAFGAV
jgi:DNA-binding CsgD family transcriptional regulator